MFGFMHFVAVNIFFHIDFNNWVIFLEALF